MRKIFALLLAILLLTMCGCAASEIKNEVEMGDAESSNSASVTSVPNEGVQAIPSGEELHVSKEPRLFKTEQEFIAAIKNDPKAHSKDEYSLEGINYYFVPEIVPEGAILDHIAIKDFYVVFLYQFDEEPDPFWERTFIFEWYRTMTRGDTEMNVRNQFSEEKIKQENEYYIIKIEPTDDYKGDNEYVCQDVYWEIDGYAFHAVVPIWFTEADIEKYCVAKKVVVN